MFVLEYLKKKNFLNRKKQNSETDVVEDEAILLAKFKEEISNEIGAISLKNNEREDK